MVVSRVVYGAHGAVGFDEGVLALHDVTIARFPLALLIAGVAVSDSIVELVTGVGLKFIREVFYLIKNITIALFFKPYFLNAECKSL